MSTSRRIPRGISLSNTVHSDVAPCLPLPSLPVFCGSVDQEIRLSDDSNGSRSVNRNVVLNQADKIASLLQGTDVSYLNLKGDPSSQRYGSVGPMDLYDKVLRCNPEAFESPVPGFSGHVKEQLYNRKIIEEDTFQQDLPAANQAQRDTNGTQNNHDNYDKILTSSRKQKAKKKGSDITSIPDAAAIQDAAIGDFCAGLENLCGRAEMNDDDREESEWLPLPLADIRVLVNDIVSIRAKNFLHLVPVDILVRTLRVLDHQIHRAEGLSINECEHADGDVLSSVSVALESIHAALLVMANNGMPKKLYNEEMIERILEFFKYQMMDIMSASDPAYRALHRPSENGNFEDEVEEPDADFGSASKRRRTSKSVKVRKSSVNRVSAFVNTVDQKLCIILGLLKDLLTIERLSDSCIFQLVKTSFSTFLVDNIQLLQLKALSLICGIFYSYIQHRTYVIDEVVLLLLKLPMTKRPPRHYHLPDDEQKQIQMITALLIQLVHCSANLPDALRESDSTSFLLELSIDASYPSKCHEAVTEACCHFWTRVLQRFTSTKSHDAAELRNMMDNLVADLLMTLNLPEYPASAVILEVLCVLLLQNAGLKSKDIAARSMTIELLGTVAARLKQDAVLCRRENFWIVKEFMNDDMSQSYPKDACSVCLGAKTGKSLVVCQGCQRLFHVECMGVREDEISIRSWDCQFCVCREQLLALQSYCKSQCKNDGKRNTKAFEPPTKMEIVQQMLLNYLPDAGSSVDMHLITRWFYLCSWYKDDLTCQQKLFFFLARLKSRALVRDSKTVSSVLKRNSVKKITLAMGQNNSFSRGFDKILQMLLASLRENSPVIRAKALRAVSIIVEADPEVLRDKHVQSAVEDRFCDSSISVREVSLELVGRYITSHPDVGVKYFEKVAERIKDTGVSVRKRAIKIIRDMCTANPNFSEFTNACIVIISRISDEESSIQDLVCKTFYEFWFDESSSSQTRSFGDGSSVPIEVAKKTEQIVEMQRRMKDNQLLVTVIKRNLALDFFTQSAKAAGINPVTLASVRKRCELMCKCLLERILQVEEMTGAELELSSLPYVLLLHAFCTVDPALCAPSSDPSQFVVTLEPYLKSQADSRGVAQLLESIVFVIDSVLPLAPKIPQAVVEELEQDLKQMIVRHSFLTVVHACIKCLCTVSKVAGKGARVVEYLIHVFFKRLDALGFDNKQQVGRSLFCLGLLIRYGNSLLSSKRNLDVENSVTLFKKYLTAEDFVFKIRSLQALGYVLVARPEFMLEKDVGKILEATLSSSTDYRLKMQSLQNLYEYLLDAESQMGTDNSNNNEVTCSVEGGQSVPVAAGAGDTNICGGIVQLYWESILGRCLDEIELVRRSALKIVEAVLRQGLVHPITCVPYLIALETDPQEVNSKLAHHLLMNMNEKYPAFFESRLGDGLQMSFIFIQSMNQSNPEKCNAKLQSKSPGNVKGKSDASSVAYAKLGVSRIYKLIRGNRVSRNKFMSSVIRKFDTPACSSSVIPFLMYCAEILALLPFSLLDEPLYLVYAINRVLQVRAGTLEANMKALLHLLQSGQNSVAGNGEILQKPSAEAVSSNSVSYDLNGTVVPENADADFLVSSHSAPRELNLHSVSLHEACGTSEDVLRKVQEYSLAASALQLLMKLKRHLKVVFSLDDARCQAFSPNESQKSGDVLSRQNIPFNISETHLDLPSTYNDLLQRYQEFKNALREDTVDYSTYTANIKRKRPTPKRAGKSNRMIAQNDDDAESDEDWESGGRRVNIGRKGSSIRTRQRL